MPDARIGRRRLSGAFPPVIVLLGFRSKHAVPSEDELAFALGLVRKGAADVIRKPVNGYVESFNGKLRDELLNRELFLRLPEARYVLDEWRLEYNHRRPHSGIHWQTPAAFAATLEDKTAGVFPVVDNQPTLS